MKTINYKSKYFEQLKINEDLKSENTEIKRQLMELCYSKTDVTQAQYDAVIQQNKQLQQELGRFKNGN